MASETIVQNEEEVSAFSVLSGMKREKAKGRKRKASETLTDVSATQNINFKEIDDIEISDNEKYKLSPIIKTDAVVINPQKRKKNLIQDFSSISKKNENNANANGKNNVDIIELFDLSEDENDKSKLKIPCSVNSKLEGERCLKWLICPHSLEEFFHSYWEKKPLHISRKNKKYYTCLTSLSDIDQLLRNDCLKFSENIDITSYDNGVRQTHNPVGRAYPHVIWDFLLNGCSIRFLNPQVFIPKINALNASLQEYFNSFVGANIYLTPGDSQGFAPHYDDIEAFVVQIEGKKNWKIYAPLNENEVLPRVSSKNFDQSEIGDPIMEVELEAGDMLYFPRGFIHQASTGEKHSLHCTISTYQNHSWGDFFEKMLPHALQIAIQNDVEFRKGVPLDLYENLGLVHTDSNTSRRKNILKCIGKMFNKISKYFTADHAADQLFKGYIHAALPPILSDFEIDTTIHCNSDRITDKAEVINRVEIQLNTEIKLLRENILRMVAEDDVIRVYYCSENSKTYHEYENQYLELDETLAPAVETLITMYPKYVFVEQLNVENVSDKLQIASDLWEKGLIRCKEPLKSVD